MEEKNKPGTCSKQEGAKMERKVIEKNRRDQMRSLYSQLHSLLPASHASSKDAINMLEQTNKAIDYINELKVKIEKSEEKKAHLNKLTGKKRLFQSNPSSYPSTSTPRAPKLVIREIAGGSGIEIVLTSGLEYQFLFTDIITIICEEGLEVVNADFTVFQNSVLHMVIAKITDELSSSGVGAVKVIERLEKLINGSTSNNQPQPEEPKLLWNYLI